MTDSKRVTVGPGWLIAMSMGLACAAVGAGVQWSAWMGLFVLGLGFSGLLLGILTAVLLAAARLGRQDG